MMFRVEIAGTLLKWILENGSRNCTCCCTWQVSAVQAANKAARAFFWPGGPGIYIWRDTLLCQNGGHLKDETKRGSAVWMHTRMMRSPDKLSGFAVSYVADAVQKLSGI